jgi:alpha-galactosidase
MKRSWLFILVLATSTVSSGFCNNKPKSVFKTWAQTPPMGWNSYDCFGAAVNEAEIRGNARMMQVHLKDAGWEYVVVDYCWYYQEVGALNNPPQTNDFKPSLPMDKFGRLQPAVDRFPSAADGNGFKALGDYIHSLGLKFGIHIMRGIPREAVAKKMVVKGTQITADQIADTTSVCDWLNHMYGVDMDNPGAQDYYNSLLEMYAGWGIDYIKVDDISSPYSEKEVAAVRIAIDKTGRPIVLSLSPGGKVPIGMAWHMKENANMWRISGDFWDNWEKLKHQFDLVDKWQEHIAPGGWPDADMIPIGLLNRRGPDNGLPRYSNFTDVEKYTLMSLWCICRSPLMYGGDLMGMRPVELKLLTNKEVLEVNQNSSNNRQLFRRGHYVAWIADVPDTSDKYLALFNLGDGTENPVQLSFADLGFKNKVSIRDLWAKKDIGEFEKKFSPLIQPHGSRLYKLSSK